MNSIPSIYLTSNPIRGFFQLMKTNKSFFDLNNIKIRGFSKKSLETLIEAYGGVESRVHFKGQNALYNEYEELVAQNIDKIKGKPLLFLGVINRGLRDKTGTYKQVNLDDFSNLTDFFPRFANDIYLPSDQDGRDYWEQIVFKRIGLFDFDWQVAGGDNAYMFNPFEEEVATANIFRRIYWEENHRPEGWLLGSTIRAPADFTKANYKINENIISPKVFKKNIQNYRSDAENEDYIEALFSRFKKAYDKADRKTFVDLCFDTIVINRAILREKLKWYIKNTDQYNVRLYGKPQVTYYDIMGDPAKAILELAVRDLNDEIIENNKTKGTSNPLFEFDVVRGGILQNTKMLPLGGPLEAEALNALAARGQAIKGKTDIKPVIVKNLHEEKTIRLKKSSKYPQIRAGAPLWDIESDLEKVDKQFVRMADESTRINLEVSVMTSEVLLYVLNTRTFEVDGGDITLDWQKDVLGYVPKHASSGNLFPVEPAKVQPLDLTTFFDDRPRFIRPSSSSSKCLLHTVWNTKPLDQFPPGFESPRSAIEGNIIHAIFNEFGVNQKGWLSTQGITPMEKQKYCEVPIRHNYQPTDEEYAHVKETIEKKIKQSENKFKRYHSTILEYERESDINFYQLMIDELMRAKANRTIIVDGGKPDFVGIIEPEGIVVIGDMKRRVGTYYANPSFPIQTARYGIPISKALGKEKYYTIIVQTPAGPRYNKKELTYDVGNYRKQTIRIKENKFYSDHYYLVTDRIIMEYLGRTIVERDQDTGYFFRDLKKHENNTGCGGCFANLDKKYLCNWFMTGRQGKWEDF